MSNFYTKLAATVATVVGLEALLVVNYAKANEYNYPIANVSKGTVVANYGYNSETSRYHEGIDIAFPKGTKIKAPFSGTIVAIRKVDGPVESGPDYILLQSDAPNTDSILFGNVTVKVKEGQHVKEGDVLGIVEEDPVHVGYWEDGFKNGMSTNPIPLVVLGGVALDNVKVEE